MSTPTALRFQIVATFAVESVAASSSESRRFPETAVGSPPVDPVSADHRPGFVAGQRDMLPARDATPFQARDTRAQRVGSTSSSSGRADACAIPRLARTFLTEVCASFAADRRRLRDTRSGLRPTSRPLSLPFVGRFRDGQRLLSRRSNSNAS